MTNENVYARKKYLSIRLTKALKVYNETFCPLISMLNNSTNKPRSNFIKHIQKRMSQSLYIMIIQTVSTEMFKVNHKVCLEIIIYVFVEGTNFRYNLRCSKDFRTPLVTSVYHEIESISDLGSKIWDTAPDENKERTSLNSFR